MSAEGTKKLLRVYEDNAPPSGFLMSQFRSPARNFHTSEAVEIDVKRRGRSIAIAMASITTDGHRNEVSQFTNKEWVPPVFLENIAVDAFQALKRAPGQTPYEEGSDPSVYNKRVMAVVFDSSLEMHAKIVRSIEVMSSQVLQTGKLTLPDATGGITYDLDFKPKTTHFTLAGNDWNSEQANPLLDIESLAEVIRVDGKVTPNQLFFGRLAWQDFLADETVQARLDNRRMDLGQIITPERQANGAVRHGVITVGSFKFELFTYPDSYDHPQTGVDTPYITDDHVIMKSTESELDLSFGDIPRFPGANVEALPFIPRRIVVPNAQMMMSWRVWYSNGGNYLNVQVGARPLPSPTAIDSFGCINTRA